MIYLHTLLVNISESVFANCYYTCIWLIMHYMSVRTRCYEWSLQKKHKIIDFVCKYASI